MKRYRIILLTGASSGNGKELAYALAPQAERIVLVARRSERLEAIARDLSVRFGVSAFPLPADLSVPGEAARVFEKTVELVGEAPDLLVNDAGVGFQGKASEIPVDAECKMLRVNIESLMVLSKLALQAMRKKRRGVILNVSSMAGFSRDLTWPPITHQNPLFSPIAKPWRKKHVDFVCASLPSVLDLSIRNFISVPVPERAFSAACSARRRILSPGRRSAPFSAEHTV